MCGECDIKCDVCVHMLMCMCMCVSCLHVCACVCACVHVCAWLACICTSFLVHIMPIHNFEGHVCVSWCVCVVQLQILKMRTCACLSHINIMCSWYPLPQAIIHPDTGKKIFMPFRMSGYVMWCNLTCWPLDVYWLLFSVHRICTIRDNNSECIYVDKTLVVMLGRE